VVPGSSCVCVCVCVCVGIGSRMKPSLYSRWRYIFLVSRWRYIFLVFQDGGVSESEARACAARQQGCAVSVLREAAQLLGAEPS
jgi:hypothetical protein